MGLYKSLCWGKGDTAKATALWLLLVYFTYIDLRRKKHKKRFA